MAPRTLVLPAFATVLAFALPVTAEPVAVITAMRTALAITVYQGGFALVRDTRRATLPAGASTLTFTGHVDRLDPATLDLSAGDESVGDIA